MATTPDDAALDALAAALAPRLLREIRALIEAGPEDDWALAVAGSTKIGYSLGQAPSAPVGK